ncbi:hypothetical protein QLQ12_43510 [Actinoplanes sp. NEAU-A12]|uniref:Uncharacterized protein n=1 Tax=Actinoplanes sandaracinus TaxID=3045177 RepID=A0ABT6X0F0_9ACTN|nr:hypothetical protein [Actinoplanes sandaracinus]MDI6105473.1 hypothetical protein [Actinoplanes sandaracinus]
MKRPIIVVTALAVAAGLAGALATAQRPASPPEPPLVLPAVEQFAPGACRDAADTVRSLARLTHGGDGTALTPADSAELRRAQDRLVTLAPAATADVRASMDAVILALGYLRIRLDSRTLEPQYVRDVETGRAALEKTCVSAR